MKSIRLILLCLSLTSGMLTNGAELYVAASGSDTNPGTREKPFGSIARAVREAKKYHEAVTVYVLGGSYYLKQPITFTPADSRPKDQSLTIKAYGGKTTRISSSVKLKLTWAPYKNGIMQAQIPSELVFDELFINGEKYSMARYPNADPEARNYDGTAEDAISMQRIARWKNPAGGYVHALHASEWGGFSYLITGKTDTGLTLAGGYQNNRPAPMHKKYRFVENIFEELDTAGEWFFNRQSRTLYVFPHTKTDLRKAIIETPQLEVLFDIKGSSKQPVSNINIEGFELTQTLRTFMKNKEPLLRSDWTVYRKGAVTIEGGEHVKVSNCFFNAVGGNAVVYTNYNRNNELSGCRITDAGSSGVVFVGDPEAVRSPLFQYDEFQSYDSIDKTPGPRTENYPADCTVYNNLIERIGRTEKQTAGIKISMSMGITISHNTIDDVPRAGIDIGEGTWGGHLLENNDIFNTVRETGDHGSFNSWGRDRYWDPNRKTMDSVVKAHPELILLDAVKTTVIRNNRFRCDHGWDIDLDDGSSNYAIYNNLCLNGGIKLREGFHRNVFNNIIVNNSFHPHVWFTASKDTFTRNIVSASYKPIVVKDWGTQVDSNLFPDSASLALARKNGTDQHSFWGDPGFIDGPAGNFRVKASSPALAIGFKNFSMDSFGVVSPSLRAAANKVEMPKVTFFSTLTGNETVDFLGALVKNLNTLGERSATGMASETGVLVMEVPKSSKLSGAVQPNDVILGVNEKPVVNIKQLNAAAMELQFISEITLDIFRNQKTNRISVTIK